MIPFRKMQGLGNDFAVFDAREQRHRHDAGTGAAPSPTGISASAATRWS